MANHKKPTPEELQAQTDAALAAAEELKDKPPVDETSPEEEAKIKKEAEDELAGKKPEDIPEPKKEDEEEPVKDKKEEEDQAEPSEEEKEALKKKLSASARENQKIYAKNRVINKALIDADEIPEPSEDELAKEFSDWEEMTETGKSLAKEAVVSRNWRKKISEAKEQATKIEKWNESVEQFVDDPKTLNDTPELEGKIDDFKQFATQESNNSVPMKILVSAFLHEQSSSKKPNKGTMFERSTGGSNERPQLKNGKISLEEGRRLRETDYNSWKEKNSAGLIEFDI